jgi:hypothetical protein
MVDDVRSIYKSIRWPAALEPHIDSQPIELSNSLCTATISGAPIFLVVTDPTTDHTSPLTFPFFISDIRFEKQSTGQQTGFDAFFHAHGVTYIFNTPLSHYVCLALDNDAAQIFSTYNTATFAQETPVSTYASGSGAQELRSLEARLAKGNGTITQSDAVAYITEADTLPPAMAPTSTTRTLESLSLQMQDNSSGFDNFVRDIVQTERANMRAVGKGVPVNIEAPYVFYVRSAFLGLYMGYNSSYVGTHDSLFPPNNVPMGEQPFILYSELPHTPALRETVVHDIAAYFLLHDDPSYIPKP